MELELMEEKIRYYEAVLDAAESCEETMEAIVPDALPDIGRIIAAEGTVLVRDKEVADGSARVEGVVAVTVIYAPEPEDTVKKLTMSIPFTCAFTAKGVTAESELCIACEPTLVEARALNPRKVLSRVNVRCRVWAYTPEELCFCTRGESTAAETKTDAARAWLTMDVSEKTFSLLDELEMPSGRPALGEILASRVRLETDEAKSIGNKVVFKGLAVVTVQYRTPDGGEINSADFELPFSQIVELSRGIDDPKCFVSLLLTGMDISALEGYRGISAALYLAAQVTACSEIEIDPVTDIYSVTHEVAADRTELDVKELLDKSTRRVSLRETVEVEETVRSVCGVSVLMGDTEIERGAVSANVTASLNVSVTYLNTEGSLRCVTKQLKALVEQQCPENAVLNVKARVAGESYALPVSGGVEVRLGVDFELECLQLCHISTVTAARLGEERDVSKAPSIVLKACGEDSLWELAKRYGATVSDIKKANGCDEPERDRLLLIPRKRGK